jgi:hypothetical protein
MPVLSFLLFSSYFYEFYHHHFILGQLPALGLLLPPFSKDESQTSPIAFLLGFPRQQAWGIHGVEYTYLYFFKVNQLP